MASAATDASAATVAVAEAAAAKAAAEAVEAKAAAATPAAAAATRRCSFVESLEISAIPGFRRRANKLSTLTTTTINSFAKKPERNKKIMSVSVATRVETAAATMITMSPRESE
ncbi:Hypothetical predicted protein, partial [Paramuricea clavata]